MSALKLEIAFWGCITSSNVWIAARPSEWVWVSFWLVLAALTALHQYSLRRAS